MSKNRGKAGGKTSGPTEAQVQAVVALVRSGDFAAAEAKSRKLVKAAPGVPSLWLLRGIILDALGKRGDAVEAFRKVAGLEPRSAEAQDNLGLALTRDGRLKEAVSHFSRSLDLDPRYAPALANMSAALLQLDRPEEAVAAFERHMELVIPDSAAHNTFASMLKAAGRIDDALTHVAKALELDPANALAVKNKGNIEVAKGDIEAARESFKRSVELNPSEMDWLNSYASIAKLSPSDELAERARRYLADGGDEIGRANAAFMLGKVHDRAGDYAQAADYLKTANQCFRSQINYDLRRVEAFHKGRIERFGSAPETVADAETIPIFVIGLPRSGSTVVEQILTAHPMVEGVGESSAFPLALETEGAAEASSTSPAELWRRVGAAYLGAVRSKTGDARFIVDKRLYNFEQIGAILHALPQARFVHTFRDPRDNALSLFQRRFTRDNGFCYDPSEIKGYYRLYRRLMAHWRDVAGDRIHDVVLENLVARPEEVCRHLFEWLGLDFDPAFLDLGRNDRPVLTASAVQVRSGLTATYLDRWRHYEALIPELFEGLDGE